MNHPKSTIHPNTSAGAGTVRKAVRLLECLAEAPEAMGLTEIAQATALNKATAHRLLTVLRDAGLVGQDERDRRYRLGLRLAQFGTQALERLEIRRLARPHMVSLMQATAQTVHLAILEGSEVVYAEKVEGLEAVTLRSRVGGTPPAHATSVGKCLLAFLPPEERELLVSRLPLPRFTRHTITNRAAFRRHLQEVRRRGYAVDDEDHREGLRCVGAPVFDGSGRAVAAVSIAGPTFRIAPAAFPGLARQVMDCAQAISAALGYRRGTSAPAQGPATAKAARAGRHLDRRGSVG
jgi:IclR family acetate operon transcriptional repressor